MSPGCPAGLISVSLVSISASGGDAWVQDSAPIAPADSSVGYKRNRRTRVGNLCKTRSAWATKGRQLAATMFTIEMLTRPGRLRDTRAKPAEAPSMYGAPHLG